MPLSERSPDCISASTQEDMINGVTSQTSSRDMRRDQLRAMMIQEDREGYKCSDYLSYYTETSSVIETVGGDVGCTLRRPAIVVKNLNVSCRTSICEWMYRVVDHFGVDREVVAIALSYIDRVLSINYCADRRTFKLISSTSLHLAIKVHFPTMWKDVGRLLPDLSRGDFCLEDLVGMEKELVHSLTWLLNPPTPQCMAVHILSLLPSDSAPRDVLHNITNTALFLIELSVCDYFFTTTSRSVVAIAAVLNAAETVGFDPFGFQMDAFSYHNDFGMLIDSLMIEIGQRVGWCEVSSARDRLWNLYRQSSESTLQQRLVTPTTQSKPTEDISSPSSTLLQGYPSPTSACCVENSSRSIKRSRSRSDFDYYVRLHSCHVDEHHDFQTSSKEMPDNMTIEAQSL